MAGSGSSPSRPCSLVPLTGGWRQIGGRGGGGEFQGEGPGLVGGGGGGVWGEKSICGLKTPPLLGKIQRAVYTWSHPHFIPR